MCYPCGTHFLLPVLSSSPYSLRPVLIDLHRVYGNEKIAIDHAMLADVMRDQRVTVEPGDILALRTGWSQLIVDMHGTPDKQIVHHACAGLDGRDPQLLRWITDSGVAAIVADNVAVEFYPPRPGEAGQPFLPLHELCLFKLGINLGEMWYLTELADWLRDHDRNRFFLTAPPLRLRGHAAYLRVMARQRGRKVSAIAPSTAIGWLGSSSDATMVVKRCSCSSR